MDKNLILDNLYVRVLDSFDEFIGCHAQLKALNLGEEMNKTIDEQLNLVYQYFNEIIDALSNFDYTTDKITKVTDKYLKLNPKYLYSFIRKSILIYSQTISFNLLGCSFYY